MPHRARISVSPDRLTEVFASSSQGFVSTFAGMEVAVDTDNDRKIGMLENPMKFDFQLSHKTLVAL
jgi:hypothetical protein